MIEDSNGAAGRLSPPKKPYEAPTLNELGSIGDMVQQNIGYGPDGGALYNHS